MSHAIVAEVRLLPRVIDFSVITDAAGVGAVAFTMVGAVLRYDRDRLTLDAARDRAVRWEERNSHRQ